MKGVSGKIQLPAMCTFSFARQCWETNTYWIFSKTRVLLPVDGFYLKNCITMDIVKIKYQGDRDK